MRAELLGTGLGTPVRSGKGWSASPEGSVALERCIRHIILHDLRKGESGARLLGEMKRRLFPPQSSDRVPSNLPIGDDGLGLDSLAVISAASAVSRFFDLGASGVDDYLLFDQTTLGWARLVERHFELQGASSRIWFETSGSMDRPALVPKWIPDLTAEVEALASCLPLSSVSRVIALAPPHHIYGFLFSVLLPARYSLRAYDATFSGAVSAMRRVSEGDLIVGTPFNWSTLMSAGEVFPPGVSGVTSAGPMPRPLWDDLAEAGLAGLVEVFGSTETGGLGWRNHGDAPFSCLPHVAKEGDRFRIRDTGTPLEPQDRLHWQGDRRFTPCGRLDRAVQIAGVNVSLERVTSVLRASDLVADAVVRPSDGRLKAFIVPADPTVPPDALAMSLAEHVRNALPSVARPVRYDFGQHVPRNEMGKLSDW